MHEKESRKESRGQLLRVCAGFRNGNDCAQAKTARRARGYIGYDVVRMRGPGAGAGVEAGAAAESAQVFDRERRPLTLGILLAVAAFAADGMGVVPALPAAVRALSGLHLFGWAFSAFMLAWLVGTVAAGQLADARGPRQPMALGLLLFALGLLLAAAARGMALFLAGRCLQGLGGGAMMAACYVSVARGYPDMLRPRMMALISTVWVLPALLGPTVSGVVAERVSWRLVFAGIVPLVGVVALLVLPPLGRLAVRREAGAQVRLWAALRLSLGAALCLAAPSLRTAGLPLPLAGGLFVGGAGMLVLALRALLPLGTFRARAGLPAGLLSRGLLAFGYFGTEAFIPLSAGELRGATPTQAGLALSTGAIGWFAAAWMQDRLEQRLGSGARVRFIGVGLTLCVLGMAAVAGVLLSPLPFLLVPLGWAVGGAGIGMCYTAGSLLCITQAPPEREGEVSGQLQLSEALGTALGTGVGGVLLTLCGQIGLSTHGAHAAVFAVPLGAVLLAVSIAGRLVPPGPAPAATGAATGRPDTPRAP